MGSSLDFSKWLCIQAVCKFPNIWILHEVGEFVFHFLYFPLGEWLFFLRLCSQHSAVFYELFHSNCEKGSLKPLTNLGDLLLLISGWVGFEMEFRFSISKSAKSNDKLAVGSPRRMACNFTESWGGGLSLPWPYWKGLTLSFFLGGIAEALIPTLNTLHLNWVHKSVSLFWTTYMLENLLMSLGFGFLTGKVRIMIPTSQGCCEDCSIIFMLVNYNWKASFKHALAT